MRARYNPMIPLVAALALGVIGLLGLWNWMGRANLTGAIDTGRPAKMHPDYTGVTVPPNIAPLNFVVDEPGRQYCLRISSPGGRTVQTAGNDRRLIIPPKAWRKLLTASAGQSLSFEVFVRRMDGGWQRFTPFTQNVAPDPIDSHLVYRLLPPTYNNIMDMGIYQRDLTAYDESPVVCNNFIGGCVNCHTFHKNNPDRMFFQTRTHDYATIIVEGGKIRKVQASGGREKFSAGIGSWSTDGRSIAFTMDRFYQFFHTAGPEPREALEIDGNIADYRLDGGTMTSAAELMDPRHISTYPCWAPDGRTLYYARAPLLWTDMTVPPVGQYAQVRYELRQIPYDPQTGRWEPSRPLLAVPGKSLTQPRVSPDGRFLLFCMADCGPFPAFRAESDLYMLDLKTGKHWRLDNANSPLAESWHCWSSNGRWIVLTSRRIDGLLGRPFICHIDADGQAAKPFLVPQKDPTYYDRNFLNYNVPELATGPVKIDRREVDRLTRAPKTDHPAIPITITSSP
jgi:hypothetical protein